MDDRIVCRLTWLAGFFSRRCASAGRCAGLGGRGSEGCRRGCCIGRCRGWCVGWRVRAGGGVSECRSEGGCLSRRVGGRGSGGLRRCCRACGRRRVGGGGGRRGCVGGGLRGCERGSLCGSGSVPRRSHPQSDEAQHVAGYGHADDGEQKTVGQLLSFRKVTVPLAHSAPETPLIGIMSVPSPRLGTSLFAGRSLDRRCL